MKFIVEELGAIDNGRVLSCGGSGLKDGESHYFNFQRSLLNDKDEGIYFEFDDQGSGDYNSIESCNLTTADLNVRLKYGPPKYAEFLVEIDLTKIKPLSLSEFKSSLTRIFKGYEGLLTIGT
jgi:hypothetical protein